MLSGLSPCNRNINLLCLCAFFFFVSFSVFPFFLSLSSELQCSQPDLPIPSISLKIRAQTEREGLKRVLLEGSSAAMVMSADNIRGLVLALSSSFFIGSSFIVKKKGLKKAGILGVRAGSGGFSYLYEPLWWVGMITMIVGEVANFAAYAFAPAILVTPLGALSIIVSAVLAHFYLDEKLHLFGILGCVLCVVGSTSIVLHAPKERDIESVKQLWHLATEPGFVVYSCVVVLLVLILIIRYVPRYGQTHMLVYIGICSLMGSLTVMSVKALGIALKLSFSGMNQFIYAQTWFFTAVVVICCLTQLNYLNKALDTFNTAVISPVYYVMFTTFTIFASMIMFKDWASQDATQIISELSGFVTILSGTFLLHKTKDMGNSVTTEPTILNEIEEHQYEVSSSESLSIHIDSPMEVGLVNTTADRKKDGYS